MRIYLGGHLNFYHPQKESWLEVKLDQPAVLRDVLESLGIPPAEVYLVAVNKENADLQEVIVSDEDEVKLYPAVGGGQELSDENRSR